VDDAMLIHPTLATKNKQFKMTVTETVIRRVFDLTEEQRYKLLIFIEKLAVQPANQPKPLKDPYGIGADIRTDLSFEEFKQNRQALWGQSTDEELR
jgi:hypothetical protein